MTRLTPMYIQKRLNITYKTPQETLGTAETLPTTEPENPQVSYTITWEDLPTFNFSLYQKVYVAYIIVSGKCPTAATIYYRMLKNSVSVYTSSSSVSANYYYTLHCYFYDVTIGDVLEVKLWSNQTNSYWDYKAYQIQVTRIIPMDKPRLFYPCSFETVSLQPTLTLGNPNIAGAFEYYVYHLDRLYATVSTPLNVTAIYPLTYGLYRIYNGDYNKANSGTIAISSTYHPYNNRNYVPTLIVMRGVKGD